MKFNRFLSLLGVSLLALGITPQIDKGCWDKIKLRQGRPPSGAMAPFQSKTFQAYTSPFGYRISPTGGYTREFHSGLDFAAPTGSYIRSWWSGRVVSISDNTACGTAVRIQSGSWLHVYCHMQGYVAGSGTNRYIVDRSSGLRIREGQTVKSGQRIGRVGMTGRTTGPHLHWTLKYQGKLVDPAAVLRVMYTSQKQGRTLSQKSL